MLNEEISKKLEDLFNSCIIEYLKINDFPDNYSNNFLFINNGINNSYTISIKKVI